MNFAHLANFVIYSLLCSLVIKYFCWSSFAPPRLRRPGGGNWQLSPPSYPLVTPLIVVSIDKTNRFKFIILNELAV